MNYLEPYKGKNTRHTCPACKTKHSFTLYLNGDTHEPINSKVGKCNREIKCGYHYTPKQYFMDNPTNHFRKDAMRSVSNKTIKTPKPITTPQPIGTIPFSFVVKSLSPNSNFVTFLRNNFTENLIEKVFENYYLGATKNKEVIFWQIDIQCKVRTGKIMQYNSLTGKRIKHQSGAINWVHNKLKLTNQLPNDFHLRQCFFGEHLLNIFPSATVAIVESEKTACIASCIIPQLIWIAAGNLNGLSIEKCQVLKNRKVILFPDQGAFLNWNLKAKELRLGLNQDVFVSDILEHKTCVSECFCGLDVADFILWP